MEAVESEMRRRGYGQLGQHAAGSSQPSTMVIVVVGASRLETRWCRTGSGRVGSDGRRQRAHDLHGGRASPFSPMGWTRPLCA